MTLDAQVADVESLRSAPLERQVEGLLACPRCHARLAVSGTEVVCQRGCGFEGALAQRVVIAGEHGNGASFFDDKHEVMREGNEGDGVRCLCYDRQEFALKQYLKPGALIVDVGCGGALPYERTPEPFIIGVEPSFDSIRANQGVDLRIYGSGASMPLPDRAVDLVVCLYSVHHMVGSTRASNAGMVRNALREFGRVVKPGGHVLVFEIEPWPPFWHLEQRVWNTARSVLGRKLDMHFWSAEVLDAFMRAEWPQARLRTQRFDAPALSTFPPVFSLPWLKFPRFLYPFSPVLLDWQF